MSKAYLLGVMHDATERKNTYRISSKEKKFIHYLARMIHKIGYNAWTYKEGKTRNLYVVEFSKKQLVLSKSRVDEKKSTI